MNRSDLFHEEIHKVNVDQRPAVVIATVEQKPDLIPWALDRLLGEGEVIDELVVVHLGEQDQPPQLAHQQLALEMKNGPYQQLRCRWQELQFQGGFLAERQINAANRQIHDLIGRYKCAGRRLHVVVSDNRGVFSLLVMSAAMLNFDHEDQLWQMYFNGDRPSDEQRRRAKNEFKLIKVPTLPLGQYFASLRGLGSRGEQTLRKGQAEQKRCQNIVAALTPMQLEVLRAFAGGLSLEEVSDRLSIEISTVHSHKRIIYQLCREAWGYESEKHLTYHFLAQQFGPYFQMVH